jgi:hypothetical protein
VQPRQVLLGNGLGQTLPILPVCDSTVSPMVRVPDLSLGLVHLSHSSQSVEPQLDTFRGLKAARALDMLARQTQEQREKGWNHSVADPDVNRYERQPGLVALHTTTRFGTVSLDQVDGRLTSLMIRANRTDELHHATGLMSSFNSPVHPSLARTAPSPLRDRERPSLSPVSFSVKVEELEERHQADRLRLDSEEGILERQFAHLELQAPRLSREVYETFLMELQSNREMIYHERAVLQQRFERDLQALEASRPLEVSRLAAPASTSRPHAHPHTASGTLRSTAALSPQELQRTRQMREKRWIYTQKVDGTHNHFIRKLQKISEDHLRQIMSRQQAQRLHAAHAGLDSSSPPKAHPSPNPLQAKPPPQVDLSSWDAFKERLKAGQEKWLGKMRDEEERIRAEQAKLAQQRADEERARLERLRLLEQEQAEEDGDDDSWGGDSDDDGPEEDDDEEYVSDDDYAGRPTALEQQSPEELAKLKEIMHVIRVEELYWMALEEERTHLWINAREQVLEAQTQAPPPQTPPATLPLDSLLQTMPAVQEAQPVPSDTLAGVLDSSQATTVLGTDDASLGLSRSGLGDSAGTGEPAGPVGMGVGVGAARKPSLTPGEKANLLRWLLVPRQLALKERNSERTFEFALAPASTLPGGADSGSEYALGWWSGTGKQQLAGFICLEDIGDIKQSERDPSLFIITMPPKNPRAIRNSGGLRAMSIRASSKGEATQYALGISSLRSVPRSQTSAGLASGA